MSVAPAFDEQNGNSLVITWNIFKTTAIAPTVSGSGETATETDNNYWYSRFTTKAALR